MTRAEAEALATDMAKVEGITGYAKHIPGFWSAWQAGDTVGAVLALRGFLEDLGRRQPEYARLLSEKLDAVLRGEGL